MTDIQLSAHFTLLDLCESDYAERNGIDNTPPEHIIPNLRRLAYSLDEVRAVLTRPVHVTSGYRCEALERALAWSGFLAWCKKRDILPNEERWAAYFANKRHPQGLAGDITCRGYGTPLQVCVAIAASEVEFDQLIYEHSWVHFGLALAGVTPRREILTLMADGRYEVGIVERS